MEKSDSTEKRTDIRTADKGKCVEKLHSYQQEGRQQPKRSTKKKFKDMER